MKADLTRSTFRPEKHYRSVRMQQGRVQLDADWNEQADIGTYLNETTRVDVIGPCGAPEDNAGFGLAVTPGGADLTLSPGRLYVDGVLCELEATPVAVTSIDANGAKVASVVADGRELRATDWVSVSASGAGPFVVQLSAIGAAGLSVTFSASLASADVEALKAAGPISLRHVTTYKTQPEPHDDVASVTPPPQGTYVAFIDQWERLRTALDDDRLREPALGGPDTATRSQTVWQVRLLRVGDATDDITCASAADLAALLGSSSARLRARTKPEPAAQPCHIPDAAGYSGLENQLYRVEIHDGGPLGTATFKWSRENGSIVTSWDGQDGANLTVGSLGRDGNLGFKAGDWVELTDDTHELRGLPGTVVRVASTTAPATITIEQPATPVSIADFPLNRRVRRWDDPQGLRKVEQPAANDGYLLGESAIEWRFEGDEFSPGNHWFIPARTGIGIEWPTDSAGAHLAKPPDGMRHHYCPLAIVRRGAVWEVVEDCRKLFRPLTKRGAEERGVRVTRVRTRQQPLLHNDTELTIGDLLTGLEIVTDPAIEAGTVIRKPTCLVALDLPFPTSDGLWGEDPVGTIPLTLRSEVSVLENVISWLPADVTRQWLSKTLPNSMSQLQLRRVLLHLTIKGNFVYEAGAPAHNVDGEAFGLLAGNVLDAKLPSGDKRRGGDLDLWYWLVPGDVEIRHVALATNAGSRVLETAVKRTTLPLAIGLAADRAPLTELLPPDFELDKAAVLDLPKAHQLLSIAQVGAAVLRTAVEAPLVPLAEHLNELLHSHAIPIRLDIVRVDDFSTILVDLVAEPQGLDAVLAGADTLDAFDATERAAFPEAGRVVL